MSELSEYVIVGGDFKHQDTTKQIQLQFKLLQNGHQTYARITRGHDYIARVANQSGYIGEYPVQTNGAQITMSTADLVDLVPDKYRLEIWETYTDASGKKQTSIWPTPDAQVPFEVHANITDKLGEQIKQFSFQDVVDQAVKDIGMNYVFKVNAIDPDQAATVAQENRDGKTYVTFNVPKGKNGQDGPAPTLHVTKVTSLTSDEAPIFNLVPVSDGNYNVEVGIPKGEKGDPGKDGKTPVRGTDYWTDADQKAIEDNVAKTVGDAYNKASDDIANQILNGKW